MNQALYQYSMIFFYVFFAVSIGILFIVLPGKKQKLGWLLIKFPLDFPGKSVFFLFGFMYGLLVLQQAYKLFKSSDIQMGAAWYLELSKLIFFLSISSFNACLYLRKIEFRDNGICMPFLLTRWGSIKSYSWDIYEPNLLTIHTRLIFSFFSGFIRMNVPERHKHIVSQILADKLPGKGP
jgi:hypothetical protein